MPRISYPKVARILMQDENHLKPGDIVLCVKPQYGGGNLSKGAVYRIFAVVEGVGCSVQTVKGEFVAFNHSLDCFRKLTPIEAARWRKSR